ncbi:hypothetical protein MB901379_01871 [Mycobacterium basiliense]|uniref:DUF732 domain-containing protein n=1 Tax=Mycobacterium basiliense TaxID=2094119 RepID=A0A447GCY9_9MYCO|nr:DUF732 domain-containing protein [Mycobacterium basiliense]VDM88314.1 hypothetical protein MB901379_01871 [Mycobacterium basiliense]
MKLLLAVIAVTGAVLSIGMAVPAHADGIDDEFLVALGKVGITYPDPARAIAAGRWVCQQVSNGTQTIDVVKQVQSFNAGLQGDSAAKFTAIAANAYCPTVLATSGGQAGPG